MKILIAKLEERNIALEEARDKLLLANRDLAERAQELERSEAKYRALVERILGFIYTVTIGKDDALTYCYISPQIQILGFSREEWMTRPGLWQQQIHPDDRERVLTAFGQNVRERKPFKCDYRILCRDDRVMWLHDEAVVVQDVPGMPLLVQGIAVDITECKQAEEALEESHRRLEEVLTELRQTQRKVVEQERLHALGQMASGIAHDFNNALTPILGYVELLLNFPQILEDKEKARQHLQTIKTTTQDAAGVVRRLREFYRKREEGEQFFPVDLNQVVTQAITLTQPKWKDQAMGRNVTIRLHSDLQEPSGIEANESELREMLTNLIFNAVDAILTKVEGAGEGETGEQSITVRTRAAGEYIALAISDTGTGMTEEVKKRCMDPFFTTKGDLGTGLGLPMVYGTVQRHEGSICIETEPGRGTTFVITLPRHHGPKPTPAATTAAPVPIPQLHVLVVDDDDQVRDVITEFLRYDGHVVETATNGAEAHDKFQAGQFDLVVTDKAMPGISGDRLAVVLKCIAPHTPVILLTGFGSMMDTVGERPAAVDVVVSKPVTLQTLREAMAKAVTQVK